MPSLRLLVVACVLVASSARAGGIARADALCGDGILEPTEACDTSTGENACPASLPSCVACACLPRCGNGILDEGEECDDGDLASTTDCCGPDCKARFIAEPCGDQSETVCDQPDRCDAKGQCNPLRLSEEITCRLPGTIDACDAGGVCDGVSLECPAKGENDGCTASVPDVVDRPVIPVTCVARGDGSSHCSAAGFADVPAGALSSGPTPRQNPLQVTRTKRGKLKKADSNLPRERVLTLSLNRLGRRALRLNGSLQVIVRVVVSVGKVPASRTSEYPVRIVVRQK